MSVVGLSFGSPTSGDGFNVASTVSTIVSNLRMVETPWKTQISTLEQEDTVISNLGSLLSNLSTNMSSLTDSDGIMAEKTGSSSNTDVLELTSATSSAEVGTHTVLVNSLASTSSGYLTELSGSSASSHTVTGSITLQVGSGTAKTITLNSSDETLSGLAKAINASGAGVTAGVVTDSNGTRLTLVSGTSGANGNITVTNNSLSAAVSSSLSATVTAGSSSATSSAAFTSVASTSTKLCGSLSVIVGSGTAQSIDMSSVESAEGGTTLANLESYINSNSSTLGFSATTVDNSDGTYSLELTSGTSGSSGTLTVDSSLNTSSTTTPLAYTSSQSGANASLKVDGVALSCASNTVSDLIPGVTFDLLATSATAVQVTIANYNTGVESALESFVSNYNTLLSAINTQRGDDASGNAEPLFGSPTLTLLQQNILKGINEPSPNGYLDSVPSADTISGSIAIQVGSITDTFVIGSGKNTSTSNTATYYTGTEANTLAALTSAINAASIGVTAAVTTNSHSKSTLALTSTSSGSSNTPEVASSLTAYSGTSGTMINYTESSDLTNLNALGLSVNTNGTISLDLTKLDSILNNDFGSVQGLFQGTNSWGVNFTTTLTNEGTSSSSGLLALAASSNSSVESTLEKRISTEESLISIQESRETKELNNANEILQEIPSELSEISALYAAITRTS